MKKHIAITTALAATVVLAPLAQAADNPFGATALGAGYQLAQADKKADGKCGEAKCGADKARETRGKDAKADSMQSTAMPAGGKQADGKCGEAKCGSDKK